jgi:hypothetical protein
MVKAVANEKLQRETNNQEVKGVVVDFAGNSQTELSVSNFKTFYQT